MHRVANFVIGKFSPQLLFHFLDHRVTLLRAFGKPFQYLIAHALDFKTMFGRSNPVANLLNPFGQFIPINRRAVTNRIIHSTRLQRLPATFLFVKRGVEHREMRVQLRVQRPRTVMHERRGHQIARCPIPLTACLRTRAAAKVSSSRNAMRVASSCATINRSSSNVTASTETDLGGEQVKS